jgi:DNA-binding transcriptional ArsR family regulator
MGTEEVPMVASDLAHDPGLAEQRAHILKALGNPVRLRIMAFLAGAAEATVGQMCDELALPQAKVSQQLAALRSGGLVRLRKEQSFHHYSLAIPAVNDLLTCLGRCGAGRDARPRRGSRRRA